MVVSKESLSDLPPTVQRWLDYSGIVGKAAVKKVYLEQEALMRLQPDQEKWFKAKAQQTFTTEPPSFNWKVSLKINPLIFVTGKDSYEEGKGAMKMKLFSLFPLVNESNNPKIDQATLQRFLAEIVWFPSAALNPYIKWQAVDDLSAKAVMTYKGTVGSGIFYFDKNGGFQKFTAMRYKNLKENSTPLEWTVKAIKTVLKNNLLIPVELEVAWKLEEQEWTWLKLKIVSIQY
ncbi:DUF6920 family protein [Eudoraea sp.]|uniref:DUF6920 family protein n=1 Tax=Eudoraea sp. TaxID=1979955 RepID=UPI003C737644